MHCNSKHLLFHHCLTHSPLGSGKSHILLGGVSPPSPPPVISKLPTQLIAKIQTPFNSPVHELSEQVVEFVLEVNDAVTSRVGESNDTGSLIYYANYTF